MKPASFSSRADHDMCIKQLKNCLTLASDAGHVVLIKCDAIISQYCTFLREAAANEDFLSFKEGTARLDTLLCKVLTQQKDASDLWPFTKKMLLLSHGQATVERVFSVNKELLADNMGGNTLVAQRVICDHVHSLGGSAVSKLRPNS